MMNNGYTYIDRIGREHAGLTVIDFYSSRHAHFTRGKWRGHIEAGRITCAGRALEAEEMLVAGQVIAYFRPPWHEPDVVKDFSVLYTDEHVVVFDKPDRIPVLPGGEFLENSMVHTVRRTVDASLSPLHRLGRGTTGVILFTRTAAAAAEFSRLMREREIGKTYLALVHGCDMPDTFTVDAPIGRVPHARLGEIHDVSSSGKRSISICTVLMRHDADDTALAQVSIPTGRTHQIRIHLASVGHPLVGDKFYTGRPILPGADTVSPGFVLPGDPGYILHSWKLEYIDPFTDRRMCVVAPPRQELMDWDERVRLHMS